MKTMKKAIPFALASLLLVGCSTELGPSNRDTNVVGGSGTYTNTTYQEIYETVYSQIGAKYAAGEILDIIAKEETENRTQAEIDARVDEYLNDFYTASYKRYGVFYETLLISYLQNQGYNVSCGEDVTPFEGTKEDFNEYDSLASSLVCDYTDVVDRYILPQVRLDFLKEDYILEQKASYLTSKKIRKVEYFAISPKNSSIAAQYTSSFETALLTQISETKTFMDLVTGEDGLEEQWKAQKISELDQDYGMIDPTSIHYVNPNSATDAQKTEIALRISTYSGTGAYPIEKGYEIALKAIQDTTYYYSKVGTSDDATIIVADIDTLLLRKVDELRLYQGFLESIYETGSIIVKSTTNSNYYFVRVSVIDASSSEALKLEGARALAQSTGNVKNAASYYLEKYGVTVYEQDLFDYLEEQYGYTID